MDSNMDSMDSVQDKSFQSFAEQNQKLQHENHRYSMLVSQLTAEVSQLRLKSQGQEASILALRAQIGEQRNEFNVKFGQFISCANQYEQSKKAEIEGLQMQIALMADKYKQLGEEYGKLTQKSHWHKPVVAGAGGV